MSAPRVPRSVTEKTRPMSSAVRWPITQSIDSGSKRATETTRSHTGGGVGVGVGALATGVGSVDPPQSALMLHKNDRATTARERVSMRG